MCTILLFVTVVETTAYDVSLDMEFMTAMGGTCDAYTKMFKYWWTAPTGELRTHDILAPCHMAIPPLYAYACFGGLISSEAELQDVPDANDVIIPEDDQFGCHTYPIQLQASNL